MGKVNKLNLLIIMGLSLVLSILPNACKKIDPDLNTVSGPVNDIENLVIANDFDFKTTKTIAINIMVLNNQSDPISKIPLKFFTAKVSGPQSNLSDKRIIMQGLSNASGIFQAEVSIPAYIEDIFLSTDYLGLLQQVRLPIKNNSIYYVLGGKNSYKGNEESQIRSTQTNSYQTLGTWNSLGVPNYLEPFPDTISTSFLSDLNATLPEYIPLPQTHPQYFQSNNDFSLRLQDSADVWVTFVHEGANWLNSLGFYYYNENNPPTSDTQIVNKTIIYPNVSYAGGGGGLYTGDKVYLGNFPAGTVIQWFLVSQGWDPVTATVGDGLYTHYYSQSEFNIESDSALRQHSVLLWYTQEELFLLGFEDINREDWACDHDFNDAVFYISADPYSAVVTTGLQPMDTSVDSDGDGVSDSFDEYPNDSTLAYNIYLPSPNYYCTLAFEDLWPETGDYDFNDLVIGYNFQMVANANNYIAQMTANYKLIASGANYHNAFGIELPFSPSYVSSVTGGMYTDNCFTINPNGTEADQSKAVIFAFEDALDLLNYPGTGIGVNTTPGLTPSPVIDIQQVITFSSGLTLSDFGTIPFNPFIVVNQNRSHEVHLIDYPPTDLASVALFGSGMDDSDPPNGKYYRTVNKLPFGINLPEDFDYPIEESPVNDAYLKFNQWAESSGALYPDWFTGMQGYRNESLIYYP